MCLLPIISCRGQNFTEERSLPFIKAVYGNPASLLQSGHRFDQLGLNAVFVRSISLDQSLAKLCREQGIRLFVEFPTLLGKDYLQENPQARPINQLGQPEPPADWFMGICPSNQDFLAYRRKQLGDILSAYKVDGIWLDYLHWHAQFERPDPILPETCFCAICLHNFQEEMEVEVPEADIEVRAAWILAHEDEKWRLWRSRVLTGWVRTMKADLQAIQPEALLGVFHCAWYPEEFSGALYRVLGIDLPALASIVDVFSPMLFHQMMARPVEWVAEYNQWLGDFSAVSEDRRPKIWPIVQAHHYSGRISPAEFRQVMILGAQPPATGIMMFSDVSLIDDQEKLAVMKELYRNGFR